MTEVARRRLAFAIFVVTVASFIVGTAFSWRLGNGHGSGWSGNGGFWQNMLLGLALGSFSVVGLLIIRRLPDNRIGWIMLLTGLSWGVVTVSSHYIQYGYQIRALPGRLVLLVGTQWAWVPAVGLPAIFGILLFPDGHLPSPRWRWVARLGATAIVLGSVGLMFTNEPLNTNGTPATMPNPLASWPGAEALNLLGLFIFVMLVCIVASAISMVLRLRRARGELREQMRWLAYAASIVGIVYATIVIVSTAIPDPPQWLEAVQFLALFVFGLIPIAIGFAVLRYRLYDIDIVISKTIVFGGLAAFITGVYVVLVVVLGALVGGSGSVPLSIGATAIVAVLFEPVRIRVQRIANRFVYGERATPYEVMAGFAARVSDTVSIDEVLPGMAAAAGEGVGASAAVVRVFLPDGGERIERWDHGMGRARDEAARFPVRYQGEPIGEIDVRKPVDEPLSQAERALLEDLAGQAGLAMHNVRLTEELAARLRELDAQAAAISASRERLVTARDAQRRGLQRDLQEGPERRLIYIGEAVRDVSRPEELDPLLEEANDTLEGLRDLARGIFPPLLADKGIEAALAAHIRKVGARTTIDAAPDVAGERFDADTEACVYFCCLQAIQNVLRHAGNAPTVVRLAREGDRLTFEIADGGPGFDVTTTSRGMGLEIMQDRVDALEGTLAVRSEPGEGTTISITLPIGEAGPRMTGLEISLARVEGRP